MAAPIKEIKRDEILRVMLYPEEKSALNKLLEGSVYTNTSEMVRDIIFNGHYKVLTVDQELRNRSGVLLQQTRNIGRNFNQLIKLLHAKKINYFTTDDINGIQNQLEIIAKSYKGIEEYLHNDS